MSDEGSEKKVYITNMVISALVGYFLGQKMFPSYPPEQLAGAAMAASVLATFVYLNKKTTGVDLLRSHIAANSHIARNHESK